jgi:DNA-directed RNA polymerase subunit omega
MARITVEDCLGYIDNRFAMVHAAAQRVRQLDQGSTRRVNCKNENVVTALREIADGKVAIEDKKRN